MEKVFSTVAVERKAVASLRKLHNVIIDQKKQILTISGDTPEIGINRWGLIDGLKRCGYIVKFEKKQLNQKSKQNVQSTNDVKVGSRSPLHKQKVFKGGKERNLGGLSSDVFSKIRENVKPRSAWISER